MGFWGDAGVAMLWRPARVPVGGALSRKSRIGSLSRLRTPVLSREPSCPLFNLYRTWSRVQNRPLKFLSAKQAISEYEQDEIVAMHHVDHMKPISKGGEHYPDNFQVLTGEKNLTKGAQWEE